MAKAKSKPLYQVHESTLSNGLKIRLVPNPSVPVVSLYTFFHVGSRNERPGITGIAHLFEHMMFNGAKRYGPKEFDHVLESHGGRSNAYTSTDLTVYYDEFAPEALERVLDLESDRMESLAIAPKLLTSERKVVLEERRVRVDNDITGMMDEELNALVFKAHPYHWPIIGWQDDVKRITREECREFFRTYYAPNNATLWISGDIDVKKTLALVKRFYGKIKKGPPAPVVPNSEPAQKGERRAVVRHPAQAPAVMLAYRGPEARHQDTFVLDVLQYVLSAGEGNRLTRELVYKQKVAVGVGFDWSWRKDPGILWLYLELEPGADPKKAEAALYAELERISQKPPLQAEVQKAKNMIRAHLFRELATNGGRAHALGNYEALLGDWREAERLPGKYENITPEHVQALAKKYFHPDRRSVVTLEPLPVDESAGPEVAA
ncbi:MAG: insulinase family protein [Myxococcota bacterium]|nr:insulinase family protein [Myxococcota bacterium]